MNQPVRYINKIMLCGHDNVGKTTIRENYTGMRWHTDHSVSLGADFSVKKLSLDDGSILELQIWDIGAVTGFENLRRRFFLGAVGLVLVFDLTSRESFIEMDSWFKEFLEVHPQGILPVLILGNKIDLKNHEVMDNEVEKYIHTIKTIIPQAFVKYYKISAKTGENMNEAFLDLAQEIIDVVSSEE